MGMVEGITMKRKRSVAKKKPEEVRVQQIVDLIDPPQRELEQAEPEPEPEPTEEPLSGVNTHLAKALEIATAECARLAEKCTGLAAERDEANVRLLTDEARLRELEGVLKQIDSFVSSAVSKEEDPEEGNGESA
jgi:hypothetical protein